jgi:hypothetical protein
MTIRNHPKVVIGQQLRDCAGPTNYLVLFLYFKEMFSKTEFGFFFDIFVNCQNADFL